MCAVVVVDESTSGLCAATARDGVQSELLGENRRSDGGGSRLLADSNTQSRSYRHWSRFRD